jgi:thymidylate synthase (FAD)
MGDDLMVVDAARVSFDKKSEWESDFNEEVLKESDKKLIQYLAENGHWTPFAHPQIQVRMTVPIFVANQLKRHQIGLAVNEVSRRYVDDEPEFYIPTEWRARPDKSIKQGSSDEIITEFISGPNQYITLSEGYESSIMEALNCYQGMIEAGVAPEMARMVLPQSMFTSWIWTGSLMAFLRIYQQRSDPHAQKESQEIARQLKEIIQPLFPVSWAAWFEW